MKIAILDGCDKCEKYKKQLSNKNISFKEVVCSENANCDYCNNIESIALCDMYPMTIIDNTIIALSDDFSKLGRVHLSNNYTIVYCHSIDNMLYIVEKYLNF